jgi:hypothetical protein
MQGWTVGGPVTPVPIYLNPISQTIRLITMMNKMIVRVLNRGMAPPETEDEMVEWHVYDKLSDTLSGISILASGVTNTIHPNHLRL